jgi:hypothetical protein
MQNRRPFPAFSPSLFRSNLGDAVSLPRRGDTGDHEIIELVPSDARTRKQRVAIETLIGTGVPRREPEPNVQVDPSLMAEPAFSTARARVLDPAAPQLEIVPDASEPTVQPRGRWQTYVDLGLVAETTRKLASKLVVSMYRLVGFGILTLIVVVLAGYIAQTAFFHLNHTWMAPVAVSSSDERVIAARSQLMQQQDTRDRTAAELAQTDRVIAAHKAFQHELVAAVKGDRDERRAALGRIQALVSSAAATRSQIRTTTDEFATHSDKKIKEELDANLITRDSALAGKYQLAQIAGANLSIAERQAEYESRAAELSSQTRALDAIASGGKGGAALSYDVLRIKKEADQSRLDLAKALADREVQKSSLARLDKTIADLKQNAYLRAVDDHAIVALVPYANLDNVTPGAPLYSCKLGFLMCHPVGSVVEVLRGEVTFKHPKRDAMIRGQMVELRLDDPSAATDDVVFIGSRPLGL